MRRKYLAAAYIAAFEWLLSWQQWDGVIKTILALWVFWELNLLFMMLATGEVKNVDYKSHQKRKAPGKRKRRAA